MPIRAETTLYSLGLFFSLMLAIPASYASESLAIHINDETEINLEVFSNKAGKSDYLYIWQPHERGIQAIDRELARQLASVGIDVWLTDLLESYFLSNTASNMDKLSGDGYAAILQEAHKTGKTIIIGASGRGAIPVLRGIHQWQNLEKDHSHFAGLILISPKLYVETPEPGTQARFMPIAEASNLAVYILQPNQSPWFWKLKYTMAALQKSGSDVYFKPMDKLRDRFYFRPDAFNYEQQVTKQLWRELVTGMSLLSQPPRPFRQPATLATQKVQKAQKKERHLEIYKGNPTPPALNLPQLDNTQLSLNDFKGKVVLVNFWATWCPPCVHEMPSMQRLTDQLAGKPFNILGVNMAETPAEVEKFLQTRVKVDFPIVLDRDGQALKDWNVFAFPTSYVIDKQGKVRLALFGSVEWDDPEIVQPIIDLINEQER